MTALAKLQQVLEIITEEKKIDVEQLFGEDLSERMAANILDRFMDSFNQHVKFVQRRQLINTALQEGTIPPTLSRKGKELKVEHGGPTSPKIQPEQN